MANRRDDAGNQIDIDPAPNAYDRRLGSVVRYDVRVLPAVVPNVDRQEYSKNYGDDAGSGGEQMLHRPKEVDAVQEADKQWRVAERGERAPDIGDQEYGEHQHMRFVLATFICPDQRPHHDHSGASGADEACQDGAEKKHASIAGGRAVQIAVTRIPPATT